MVGQFGAWTPVAAAQTATGYEVALELTGSNEFTIWNTDSSGNYLSSAFNEALGTSAQLEMYEPGFNYDLNGDGTIGIPAASLTTIESSGATSLLTDGTDFFLEPAGGSPIILTSGGSPVTAAQLSGWTPIAAQQTATGYEVALKSGAQYLVWDTDSSGNYLSTALGPVSGTSAALWSAETSFNDDLNGDGTIGVPPPKVIESSGSMSLVTDWTNYYLEPNGGTPVKLSYNGRPLRSANLALGLRSRRSRQRPAMRWPWRMWAPIFTGCGTPTRAAISSRVRSATCRARARRWS